VTNTDQRIGEVFLDAAELGARVRELGAEMARDYAGTEPVLVGTLKACLPFICDLSRAMPIHHALDFVELVAYPGNEEHQGEGIRFLKDLDEEITGRAVVVIDEVIDTGLTMNYLVRSLALHEPSSLHVATLFDRPYRRLVDDLPIRYTGFTIPDEFFVGFGFDLEGRYRNLPDLRLVRLSRS
jgi:hypoxanthine phosphoribosyltransferase